MRALSDRRVLITGGAGLIGSHIADRLLREGVAEIVVLDDLSRGRPENLAAATRAGSVRLIEGDVRDRAVLAETMAGIDLVFHQAAIRITQCAAEPRLAHEVLATGTLNVLEEAVSAGVSRIVAASSASVYGQANRFPTTEEHHGYANETFYGAAKSYLEGMLRSFHKMFGLPYVALRYFNVYGPRMDIFGVYTEVLIRWMERIAAGRPPLIFGDGEQTLDLVYVEDVARANILAAKSDLQDDVLNVGSGEEISLRDLAHALLATMDADLEVELRPERGVNPVSRRLASTERARRLLGFQARVPLGEGLRRLYEWWAKERESAASRSESPQPSTEGATR